MIKQNVFIINYNSLYEILEEIKENLSFKIIKYENEEKFLKSSSLDMTNSLIILRPGQKLLLNQNISDNFFLNLSDLPLSINKFSLSLF